MLYNIPSRTVINVAPDLLAELAAENPNVVAVKQANNDDLGPIEGLEVLAGNDEIFARTLEIGGTGGILVASHLVGPQMRELYDAATRGRSRACRARSTPSCEPIYEAMAVTANPIPVKTALEMLGVIEANCGCRWSSSDDGAARAVRAALERHGMLVAGGAGA